MGNIPTSVTRLRASRYGEASPHHRAPRYGSRWAANIMLTKSGVTLLDFGLVKAKNPVLAGTGLSMLRPVRRT